MLSLLSFSYKSRTLSCEMLWSKVQQYFCNPSVINGHTQISVLYLSPSLSFFIFYFHIVNCSCNELESEVGFKPRLLTPPNISEINALQVR